MQFLYCLWVNAECLSYCGGGNAYFEQGYADCL